MNTSIFLDNRKTTTTIKQKLFKKKRKERRLVYYIKLSSWFLSALSVAQVEFVSSRLKHSLSSKPKKSMLYICAFRVYCNSETMIPSAQTPVMSHSLFVSRLRFHQFFMTQEMQKHARLSKAFPLMTAFLLHKVDSIYAGLCVLCSQGLLNQPIFILTIRMHLWTSVQAFAFLITSI